MSSSLPTQVAEVIQTAHINRAPSPRHDLNPSTAVSTREPVYLSLAPEEKQKQKQLHTRRHEDEIDDDDDDEEEDEEEEEEIPLSVLVRPRAAARRPRSASFPPMPDLRFEQSYLRSIAGAETWGRIVWITMRDQIMMPLAQGVVYNLAIVGWQHWNRNAQMSGSSVGARLRRWWYGVNNWPLPPRANPWGL